MEKAIATLLDEEIKREFESLPSLEQGSEEHARAVEDITKLHKLRDDEYREVSENAEAYRQETERAIDRYIKLGVEIAGIILPLVFYGNWMRAGFEFESKGAFTSTTFMGLFRHFRPNKK